MPKTAMRRAAIAPPWSVAHLAADQLWRKAGCDGAVATMLVCPNWAVLESWSWVLRSPWGASNWLSWHLHPGGGWRVSALCRVHIFVVYIKALSLLSISYTGIVIFFPRDI